jgi:hypothetical protein
MANFMLIPNMLDELVVGGAEVCFADLGLSESCDYTRKIVTGSRKTRDNINEN